jgi:hypothetical protein
VRRQGRHIDGQDRVVTDRIGVDHPRRTGQDVPLDQIRCERDTETFRQQGALMEPHLLGQVRQSQVRPLTGEGPEIADDRPTARRPQRAQAGQPTCIDAIQPG